MKDMKEFTQEDVKDLIKVVNGYKKECAGYRDLVEEYKLRIDSYEKICEEYHKLMEKNNHWCSEYNNECKKTSSVRNASFIDRLKYLFNPYYEGILSHE